MAEEFETRLHQLNDAFVASTTASLNIEEALTVVKRRAATDLQHDGRPSMAPSLEPVLPLIPRTTAAIGAAIPRTTTTITATISYAPAVATSSVADLLLRVGDGDPAAWEEIVRRYGKLVSLTVCSFRLQDADARDAVQATWLWLAENAHRVNFPERLGGLLATTARRECLHILRQARLGPNLTDVVLETVVDSSADPEQQVIEADTTQTLWKLVAELSPRRRTLLRALFADNPRSYDEAARIAGIPLAGIGPTRARALRQLRDKLNKIEPWP
jgi:RNA polymerase sigma factor (sigma-70 family)